MWLCTCARGCDPLVGAFQLFRGGKRANVEDCWCIHVWYNDVPLALCSWGDETRVMEPPPRRACARPLSRAMQYLAFPVANISHTLTVTEGNAAFLWFNMILTHMEETILPQLPARSLPKAKALPHSVVVDFTVKSCEGEVPSKQWYWCDAVLKQTSPASSPTTRCPFTVLLTSLWPQLARVPVEHWSWTGWGAVKFHV